MDPRKRKCRKCGVEKPITEYSKDRKGIFGRKASCKPCVFEVDRKNPSRERNKLRSHLKQKYGISVGLFHSILRSQGGLCKICEKELRPPVVDHDHASGTIRGLLCKNCNTALGLFEDNEETLASAIAYLKESHGVE